MRRVLVMLAILGVPAVLQAQYLQQPPALPALLYVRLAGPAGMKVTIYRGGSAQTLATPCVVAFRPGYRYRLELTGLPDRFRAAGSPTNVAVCPSLDVLGSLQACNGVKPSEHPVTLFFTDEDFNTVKTGSVVNKVVVLEKPDVALPLATKSDRPIEITVPPQRDPLMEARERGRPLVVLFMGERQSTPQELAELSVPGTVLLPGEKVLPAPRDPPYLPAMCYPLIDPRLGPVSPCDEICFHDGGDIGMPAGIGPDGKLLGLDPSDTIAQYFDSRGTPKIAISNKVCLCVPRYLLIRTAINTATNTTRTGTGDTRIAQAPARAEIQTAPIIAHQGINIGILLSGQKASGVVNFQQTQAVGKMDGVVIYTKAEGPGSVTGKCPEPVVTEPERPLVIFKWPDKCDGLQLGDIVTFYIRYQNQGPRPITGVIVSDSLAPRLEYVRQSARSDRDALFTITPNEADSSVLRWEVTGALPPGQFGIVTFQARVR